MGKKKKGGLRAGGGGSLTQDEKENAVDELYELVGGRLARASIRSSLEQCAYNIDM